MTMFLTPYSEYVWAAYAISAVVLVATVVATVNAWRKAKKALARHQKSVQVSETNL